MHLTGMKIREINEGDFDGLMRLYTHLHETDIPAYDEKSAAVWQSLLRDENHHIIVAEADGRIVSSCVCVIIPNLTRGLRPYALVENVVTDSRYRRCGMATACLEYAKKIAARENCYKMMLMTGTKQESTLSFYERAGYNCRDKKAFIQWL